MRLAAILGVFISLFILTGSVVYAELISGRITSVDAQNKSIQLSPQYSSQKDIDQSVKLRVEDKALKKNDQVQSLNQLAAGDDIVVEADKSMRGDWEVKSLAKMDQLHRQTAGQGQGTASLAASSNAGMEGQGTKPANPANEPQGQSNY